MSTCSSRLITRSALFIAIAVAAASAQLAGPGGYDLSWNTIDGGGGESAGGGYLAQGTIGQPDADPASLTGGGFELIGGFWPGAGGTPVNTCPADIAPVPAGDGLVNIDDLLAVINAWGACADPGNCPADIAPAGGDDQVNIDDLLAVINGWGNCP